MAQISNPVSGGQCHLIYLTILRRLSWPSLAYMCTKVAWNPFHFIFVSAALLIVLVSKWIWVSTSHLCTPWQYVWIQMSVLWTNVIDWLQEFFVVHSTMQHLHSRHLYYLRLFSTILDAYQFCCKRSIKLYFPRPTLCGGICLSCLFHWSVLQ